MSDILVSASPHIRASRATRHIMRDVIIALLPAALFGAGYQGYLLGGAQVLRPITLLLLAICGAVAGEFVAQKLMRRPVTLSDGSAIVTGLLLGMNLPPTVPLWMPLVGSVFAIVVVKQLFGGLGYNFVNPALAARCFLLVSWAGLMTNFVNPTYADAFAGATPLVVARQGLFDNLASGDHWTWLWRLALGLCSGSIGETPKLLLLLGAIYLLCRRVIDWRIPLSFLGTFALVWTLIAPGQPLDIAMLSGGLILGAFFMATDYVTIPEIPWARLLFGVGCGLLSAVIRRWGGPAEGVSYAILLMNVTVPLLNKLPVPRPFGGAKR